MSDKWLDIKKSIDSSSKNIRILDGNADAAKKTLEKYSIPADSSLGTVIQNCGGIVIEDRMRLYGAGEIDMIRRNEMFNIGATVVGEDIYGGFFFFGSDQKILYFAPDSFDPEETTLSYTPFLYWAISGNTDEYYSNIAYKGWETEAADLNYDQGIAFYPFLWTKEGKHTSKCSRRPAPIMEIVGFELDMRKQLK